MPLSTTPSISTISRNAVAVRRRPELSAVETRHRHDSAYVVKDPIAMKYHRLRPDEFFVLEQLDGHNSLEDIREAYEAKFAPLKVSTGQLNQLLFQFHQNGLTLSDAAMQGNRLVDRRRKDRRQRWMQQISGILFIRFPGVDPEPLLKRLYPLARPMLNRVGVAIVLALCLAASVVFAAHWEQFAAEFPRMDQWIRLDAILILATVIGCTKVLHELGHALVCKHFGGECHQIGPMLLVFTPALYCDTSDSWMLTSRWQRAAVGMAGIATEVLLAAVATFLWVSTAPGIVHSIAMNVMLVCSASTLLFNANPLLRYDGYYVLSDLCDTPNLGERSRKLLAGHVNRLAFGIDEQPTEALSGTAHFWMLVYAIAAFLYRWGLTLVILWFLSMVLRPHGLESIGRLLCLFAATGLVISLLRAPTRFLRNPARRRQLQMKRTLITVAVLGSLVALSFVPLPARVFAPARIVPHHEIPIYVSTPGRLRSIAKAPGQSISQGDEIARLVNHDVELQYVEAKGRFETQQQIVESIQRSIYQSPEAANQLPAQRALLDELREQLETRQQRKQALVIVAPADGLLIAAPRRPERRESPHRLVSWSGYPTDSKNRDCLVEPGQELMSLATDKNWDAELILSQSEVDRVTLGDRVILALESMPASTFEGKVSDISRGQWTVEQNGERRDDPEAAQQMRPPSTSYIVRVELQTDEIIPVAGATAKGRIDVDSISLLDRASRLLNSLFRFR